jgi:hypothetical protein
MAVYVLVKKVSIDLLTRWMFKILVKQITWMDVEVIYPWTSPLLVKRKCICVSVSVSML